MAFLRKPGVALLIFFILILIHVAGAFKASTQQENKISSTFNPPTALTSASYDPLSSSSALTQKSNSSIISLASASSTTTGASEPNTAFATQSLVGVWDQTGFEDADVHSFEFRADGTYAEMSYGTIAHPGGKDFSEGIPGFLASATSTGRWWVELPANLSREALVGYVDPGTMQPTSGTVSASILITKPLPPGTVILKLNTDNENPDYLTALLAQGNDKLMLSFLSVGPVDSEVYVRASH
jgi:hypothetical protein